MSTSINQAAKRFEKLWEIEGGKLINADITPSPMENGVIAPVDYCISTIARLIQQSDGAAVIGGIRKSVSNLLEAAEIQYIYPDESLHVSLLGCTQREEKAEVFDRDRINKIRDICIQEINKKEPAEIVLRGLGIVGNQIFIQGFPLNRNWEELRTSMADALVNNGEKPITYEDKSPIHINLIRIVNSDRDLLVSLHKVLSQLRDVELGRIKLKTIDFVITDFGVSKQNVVWLDQIECGGI